MEKTGSDFLNGLDILDQAVNDIIEQIIQPEGGNLTPDNVLIASPLSESIRGAWSQAWDKLVGR